MHFSPRATSAPNRCVVLPQLGQDHSKGYLCAGPQTGFDNDVWLSVEALQLASRKHPELGLTPTDDLTAANAEIDRLKAELADVNHQLDRAQQTLDAADFLVSKDSAKEYVVRKKTGRPKEKV